MYLINPMYFISNVVFINIERNYIFIERHCWNTMVHLIFKHHRPTSVEIRKLKDLCYDIYLNYQNNQIIDNRKFNRIIAELQTSSINIEALGLADPIIINNTKEVHFNDETEYHFDEYLTNKNINMSESEVQQILKISSNIDQFEEDVKLFLNYLKSYSVQLDALVKIVSWGRSISIFKILFTTHKVKLNSIYEYQIVKEAFDYGIARYIIDANHYDDCIQHSDECDKHIKYFSLCESCLSVNIERKEYNKPRDVPLSEWRCKLAQWYDRSGKIDNDDYTEVFHDCLIFNEINNNNVIKFTPYTQKNYRTIKQNYLTEQKKKIEYENSDEYKQFSSFNKDLKNFKGLSLPSDQQEFRNKSLSFVKSNETYDINIPKSPFFNVNKVDRLNTTSSFSSIFSSTTTQQNSPTFLDSPKEIIDDEESNICDTCQSEYRIIFGSRKCKCKGLKPIKTNRNTSFF